MQTTGWSENEKPIRGLRAKTFPIDDAPDVSLMDIWPYLVDHFAFGENGAISWKLELPDGFIKEKCRFKDGRTSEVLYKDEWIDAHDISDVMSDED